MVPTSLIHFLEQHESFLIMGHQEPDADCLGSQMALGSFLTRWGKKVLQYNHGPFKRVEIQPYQSRFASRVDPLDKVSQPGVIVLDCSSVERLGDLQYDLGGLDVAVIDHHATSHEFGSVRWIESHRPSATWMVHQLIGALGHEPTPEEAHWLLLGLATDTGFFRHVEAGAPDAFEAAAALSRAGASAKAVFAQIHGGRIFANQKLMGLVLSRAESHFQGRVMYSWEDLDDRQRLGAENRESDTIYQTLQGVNGVELIILLRQDTGTTVTGGLRSRTFVDVSALAQKFGGGGHVRASGFACEGTVAEVKARLLQEIEPLFA